MPSKTDKEQFLPDFCHVYTVFLTIIVTELLAFVLALAPLSKSGFGWAYIKKEFIPNLAMFSLFIQWITLVSMGLLCMLRRQLSKLESDIVIGLVAYLLILMVTFVVSEFAYGWHEYMLSTEFRWKTSHHQFLFKYFAMSAIGSLLILGYIYKYKSIKKDFVVLSYVFILMMTLIFTEWISFYYQTSPEFLRHQWFLWRNMGISAIISAVTLRYFYIQYHWKKEIEASANARAQALQARIRPHFLFNSMNAIACLIHLKPDKAEQAVLDFADLFRASLAEIKTGVTFQEELALCRQYLNIETLRLGERLQLVWGIDKIPEDALLPQLSLQPLLENAIYHGIQPLPDGGTISITGEFDGKEIKLNVKNPLIESDSRHQGYQMAQENVKQRLRIFYGRRAKLSLQKDANFYQVNIVFPYINQ
jgi:two-component system sensor histidine kinase AlgZ